MNRMEEYRSMMAELEAPRPELDNVIDRVCKRNRKNNLKLIMRPLSAVAACFAVFVLLVNFCTPVAYACSKVPVLKELAEAVTFSRSLTDAVANEFVQPIDLVETQNGITAQVKYLIVDQKQVNIFYTLESKNNESLAAIPNFYDTVTGNGAMAIYSAIDTDSEDLRGVCIDYDKQDVPESLRLELKIYEEKVVEEIIPDESKGGVYTVDIPPPEYLAEFDFILNFDPKFTAAVKNYPVNQTLELDGQHITIKNIEVYPSHLRMNLGEDESNTAWLRGLDFYIETDWGMKFEPVRNGIVATGAENSKSMMSFRADSSYFYEADKLKVVITGATWLDKEYERVHLDLLTGEAENMPEGTQIESVKKQGDHWIIRVKAELKDEWPMYQTFGYQYYDPKGEEHHITMWSARDGEFDDEGNRISFIDEFGLKNYPYNEVWLCPEFFHRWKAENEIVVKVQ